MQRITVTIDDALLEAIDRLMSAHGYQNRSEAIRDLARAGIGQIAEAGADAAGGRASAAAATRECVGALVYVYDHEARELSKRLTHAFHDHHDMTVATTHIHLDHESCMEVTVLRGRTDEVRHVADHITAERGVRHGRLVLVPVAVEAQDHRHGTRRRRHDHLHVRHAV